MNGTMYFSNIATISFAHYSKVISSIVHNVLLAIPCAKVVRSIVTLSCNVDSLTVYFSVPRLSVVSFSSQLTTTFPKYLQLTLAPELSFSDQSRK